jgi:hypothetical protein
MDLMEDELRSEVRLQLPMSIGSRYGTVPAALANTASATSQTRLSIVVDIQMSDDIQQVTSPTHPDIIQTSAVSQSDPTSSHRTVELRSKSFLTRSFVLVVHAEGLDAPRCFAERSRDSDTVAMRLTFVSDIRLPPVSTQEYLFLVDRSGSMTGSSIETVKRALVMMVRMLPNTHTFFNIFSFGSYVDALWINSQPYGQNCLDLAVR